MAEGAHLRSEKNEPTGTKMNKEDYLKSILDQLDSLTRIYHGTVKEIGTTSDWGLFVKSAEGNDARFMQLRNMTEADGEWCMKNLEKSYYSNDNVKTYDENFRKSVSSKAFVLCNGVDTLLDHIKDEVMETDTILKPYKFNCHGEGCFFQAHQDTCSDKNLVGTLILIPCSTFEGGDLSFPIQDRTISLSANARSGFLQFVYFDIKYSHAVTLVESGFRFSLVFNVYSSQYVVEVPMLSIETQTASDETIKSCARGIYAMFGEEENVLFYDVFDRKLRTELLALFPESITVYFAEPDPSVVYDSYEGCPSDDDDDESYHCSVDSDEDDYPKADLEDYVDGASYRVNHIIGKSSKLMREQMTQSHGGNSPCSYHQKVDFYRGILLNPLKD